MYTTTRLGGGEEVRLRPVDHLTVLTPLTKAAQRAAIWLSLAYCTASIARIVLFEP